MSDYENSQTTQDETVFGSGLDTPKRSSRRYLVLSMLVVTVTIVAGALYYILQRGSETTVASIDSAAVEEISPPVGAVEIRQDGLWPQAIEIKAGQQVKFINQDSVAHRLVANEDILKEFDSVDMLSTGDTYTYVFDTPGTYSYYDSADGIKFSGTVEVN